MATNNNKFLCRRMKELRDQYGLTMEEMAARLNKANKSSISRAESGKTSNKALVELAREYCATFDLGPLQTKQFLRGNKIVIPDTSALLVNTQLIEELSQEYYKVVVPKVVLDELDNIKNKGTGGLSVRALQLINSIGKDPNTLQRDYDGDAGELNDCKIIAVAKDVAEEFGCEVDILTNDADYAAYLKGSEVVHAIHLREYRATKQSLVNLDTVKKIDQFYADSYEDCPAPSEIEANAYFNNGHLDGVTLIISTIRNRRVPFEQRKAKILWLIAHGADINRRDCNRYYFPPISHAVQLGDYPMFHFLLKDCNANPNIGSLNPHGADRVRQKNEGNMPIMIASYHTSGEWKKTPDLEKIVRELCADPRLSINQQDENGFTALIKACANGNARCREILIEAGADKKIVDLDGKDYMQHWNECLEIGPMKERNQKKDRRRW